jgi:hypothetical protein
VAENSRYPDSFQDVLTKICLFPLTTTHYPLRATPHPPLPEVSGQVRGEKEKKKAAPKMERLPDTLF